MKLFEIRLILFSVLVGLVLGVFLHDTKVDRALAVYVAPVAIGVAVAVDLSMLVTRAHTHTEVGDFAFTSNTQLTRIRRNRCRLRRSLPGQPTIYLPPS